MVSVNRGGVLKLSKAFLLVRLTELCSVNFVLPIRTDVCLLLLLHLAISFWIGIRQSRPALFLAVELSNQCIIAGRIQVWIRHF